MNHFFKYTKKWNPSEFEFYVSQGLYPASGREIVAFKYSKQPVCDFLS